MTSDGDPSHRVSGAQSGPLSIDATGSGGHPVSDTWQGPGYWLASDGNGFPGPPSPNTSPPMASPAEGMLNASRIETPMSAAPWASVGATTATGQHGVELGHLFGPQPSQPVRSFGTDANTFAVSCRGFWRRPRINGRALRWGSAVAVAVIVASCSWRRSPGRAQMGSPRPRHRRFDEQHRGLTFKQPSRSSSSVAPNSNKEVSVPQPTSKATAPPRVSPSGGLASPRPRPRQRQPGRVGEHLDQSDVVGLYVDSKKTVFVRGTPSRLMSGSPSPTNSPMPSRTSTSTSPSCRSGAANGDDTAVTALIEGDAVRDQNLYEASLSPLTNRHTRRNRTNCKAAPARANVPEILSDMQEFPHAFGPTYVDALVAKVAPPRSIAPFAIRRSPEAQNVGSRRISDRMEAGPRGHRPRSRRGAPSRQAEPLRSGVSVRGPGSRLGYDQAWARRPGMAGRQLRVPTRTTAGHAWRSTWPWSARHWPRTSPTSAHAWARPSPGATVPKTARQSTCAPVTPGPRHRAADDHAIGLRRSFGPLRASSMTS